MPNALARAVVSLVVPPVCAGCGEPELSGHAVCPGCERRLLYLPDPRCGKCGAPVGRACDRCGECRGRSLAFDRAWSAFAYEGVPRRLVAALKSRGTVSVAGFMGAVVADGAPAALLRGAVVPVPAHPRRSRRHGFNQAAALARTIGRAAGLPVVDLLRREGASAPQVGLERRARLANMRGSVSIRGGRSQVPSSLVLIDDVYTTGATLDACARSLRDAGATDVVALTFARALLLRDTARHVGGGH
jgi:ComF family protein